MNTEIITIIDNNTIAHAANIIISGGLVAFPTETVYGLGGNALDPDAAARIYKAKGRPSDNPLIIHLAEPDDAEKYCYTTPLYYKLAARFMPGPLTVIMPKRKCIPDEVTGGLDSVAVRVPSHPVAHRFIEAASVPIAAPSANLSGKPSPTCANHVIDDMLGRINAVIDGGECEIGLESTVVKENDGKIIILRPGGVTYEMLSEVAPTEIAPAVLERFTGQALSPGMKYKHYSPNADVIIIDGSYNETVEFLSNRDECGIMCYDGDDELLRHPHAVSLGSENDCMMQAKRLFAALRDFDKESEIKTIYARMPQKNGIGLAVLNRLIRAAGFQITKL